MNAVLICIPIVIFILLVAGLIAGYQIGRKNLPKAAWQQGLKNLIFSLLIVFGAGGLMALIAIVGFRQSAENGFALSFITIFIFGFFYFFFAWFTKRRRAGKVLLDIIPYPTKTITLIGAGLFVLMGFSGTYSFLWKDSEYAWLASGLIGLCIGAMQVLLAFSRLQACENGILAYADLVKWEKIESFNWVDSNEKVHTLKLRYKGRYPGFLRNGAIPVPREKKAQLEAIFEQYVPTPQLANAGNLAE